MFEGTLCKHAIIWRHKNLCVKKEFSSATKATPGSKWKLKVVESKLFSSNFLICDQVWGIHVLWTYCDLDIRWRRAKNLTKEVLQSAGDLFRWDRWYNMANDLTQDEDSGKKTKKSPYVSPGKGKPCPECNKEFRNQGVLDRFESLLESS